MLHLSDDDASAFLEEALVVPTGIELDELIGDAVVLSHPDRVHDGQTDLLVDSAVGWPRTNDKSTWR